MFDVGAAVVAMVPEDRERFIRRVSDAILRNALEDAFVSIGEAVGRGASEELLRVEHAIVAGVRDLAPSDDLADATVEAAVHAISLIRDAFDSAHQRLGSTTAADAPFLSEAA